MKLVKKSVVEFDLKGHLLCLFSGLPQNSSTVFVNDSRKKSKSSFWRGVAHFLM